MLRCGLAPALPPAVLCDALAVAPVCLALDKGIAARSAGASLMCCRVPALLPHGTGVTGGRATWNALLLPCILRSGARCRLQTEAIVLACGAGPAGAHVVVGRDEGTGVAVAARGTAAAGDVS